jgi:homoserine kinase type II
MAVYTEVSWDEAAALLKRLGLGSLTGMQGIQSGIENTNYFVDTSQGRFVLTLFERLSAQELPFYLHLMKHLAEHGVPVPEPRADAQGQILHSVLGKPAALVACLQGHHELAPLPSHCASVGSVLARLHSAGSNFPLHQPNPRGPAWWAQTVPLVLPFLTHSQQTLIEAELAFALQLNNSPALLCLPRGPVHADLFRDNVMFESGPSGDILVGLFDFYFAGIDAFMFDVAICLNDWCTDPTSGQLEPKRAHALVATYVAHRSVGAAELNLLPSLMRCAALRFWISRLRDLHLPRQSSLLKPHDPTHFERVLRERVAKAWLFDGGAAA